MFLVCTSIGICSLIAIQDFSERKVYWWAFALLGVALTVLHYTNVLTSTQMFFHIGLNLVLVLSLLVILFLYTKFITKTTFLNHSIGLGDILFFGAMALGFPSFTFVVIFVFSIWFSLVAYMALKRGLKKQTVPLAGFMAIFLATILAIGQISSETNLYLY